MDPNQPPRHPHAHNSSYLEFDPSGNEPSSQDPNAWSYDYIPTSCNTSSATPAFIWQQHNDRFHYPPTVPSNADVTHPAFIPQHHQQHHLPSPAAGVYHTPGPDPYYLINPAAPPYAYHASSHLSAYPSPVSRSMSASAASTNSIDQTNLGQRQQTQTQGTNTFLPTPRQIRFVSTDGQPHAKRRRINAACLTCRKRKTRCSGERPVCKTCTDNGHKCAGYAAKSQRKEGSKSHGDGEDDEDDEDSLSPSPGRHKDERSPSAPRGSVKQSQSTHHYHGRHPGSADSQTRNIASEVLTDDISLMRNHTQGSGSATIGRTRVPCFRYFGPTAIAPGIKQTVVRVKAIRNVRGGEPFVTSGCRGAVVINAVASAGSVQNSPRAPTELPYYDAANSAPSPSLITSLCETFFENLGCNYPFLQRARFLQDLKEKRVDAILVNAVCAVSARFSADPILTKPSDRSLPVDGSGHVKRAFRGQPFAKRAMSAVVDVFPCPTLAVAQACLLLAYEAFGSDHDSGLWMYLGVSIRMAQDLGIQKLESSQMEGRLGPTPSTAKRGEDGKVEERKRADQRGQLSMLFGSKDDDLYNDRKASEQERIDTFWCIFFLDRAVSSRFGRPVTLCDEDIEISFPYRYDEQPPERHPDPFPTMLRIVHMYGRVSDVMNNIEDVVQVTPDVLKRLAAMEKDLTGIYHSLPARLHFNAPNFQYYVKAGQGTNFILLHFWFHTLIVLLHQPTLLCPFQGRIQQLCPNSRELLMSSAKTIADILAFAEFIDVKSFIGNPFTSQPIYIAACAFLAEVAAHSSPPSSLDYSPADNSATCSETEFCRNRDETERRIAIKHNLLAFTANQNYQRCYQALKTLDEHWAGCRYILTALEQKSKGLADPLLFTAENIDEMPSAQPYFTIPGWKKRAFDESLGKLGLDKCCPRISQDGLRSPKLDRGSAIGCSITGAVNLPAPNLSVLYQNPTTESDSGEQTQQQQTIDRFQKRKTSAQASDDNMIRTQQHVRAQAHNLSVSATSPQAQVFSLPHGPISTAEADLLLGQHSPFSASSTATPSILNTQFHLHDYGLVPTSHTPQPMLSQNIRPFPDATPAQCKTTLIKSQDVDMSCVSSIQFENVNNPRGDIFPWLEHLPPVVLTCFGDLSDDLYLNNDVGVSGQTPQESRVSPTGPGPPPQPFDPGRPGLLKI